jgi:glucosamine--fructose-6-phosphate aminotransferase (isomerizing)
MELEIKETPQVIERILENKAQFVEIVSRIKSAKIQSVMIAARGTSDNAAHYLKHLLEVELGIPVGLASPSVVTIYGTELNYAGTLVVAISQSGQSPDLSEYVKVAREGNGLTLALTNDPSSPLAHTAELHLDLMAGKEIAVAATKSYTAQLFTSYLLVKLWRSDKVEFSSIAIEAKRLLDELGSIETVLDSLGKDSSIVVIGRGYSYGNARELALKIQETSHITVQGMSAADYLHGPIAAVNSETRVLILYPKGSPTSGLSSTVARLREITKNLIWIGDTSEAKQGEIAIAGCKMEVEEISAILDATILQMFACKFAIRNGFDPDSPKGLGKVTLTL